MIIGPITEMGFPQKNRKGQKYDAIKEDRLSRLPDELIVNILSRLTLWESGQTCVLSRRWQRLWLFTTHCSGPSLIFKTPIYLDLFLPSLPDCDELNLRRKRLLYIGLLNKVFEFYQMPLLDELVLNLYLTSEFFGALDNWIKFALTKGVQRLELDLSFGSYDFTGYEQERPYVFPCLHDEKFTSCAVHRLRDLCLQGVYVDQHVVDALLSTCPLLESLSLKLQKMKDFKISADKLKRLVLLYCTNVRERVEISAPCLVTLHYGGSMSALQLKCVPCLSEFYVFDTDSSSTSFFLENDRHLSCISQLKKLNLRLTPKMIMDSPSYPMAFPEFVKLEELEMKIAGHDGNSFLWPIVFVKASPFLRRLEIVMDVYILKNPSTMHSEGERIRIKEATKFEHQFLKVVEIRRFSGPSSEIELIENLFCIGSRSLQKVVIDTRPLIRKPPNEIEGIKKLARCIRQGLDSSVDFVVF